MAVVVKKWSEVAQSCPTLCDPWTVAHRAPPSMGFSRQEFWSGLPFPSPGDLPNPGIEPRSPTLQADVLTSAPPGKFLVVKNPPAHSQGACWKNISITKSRKRLARVGSWACLPWTAGQPAQGGELHRPLLSCEWKPCSLPSEEKCQWTGQMLCHAPLKQFKKVRFVLRIGKYFP